MTHRTVRIMIGELAPISPPSFNRNKSPTFICVSNMTRTTKVHHGRHGSWHYKHDDDDLWVECSTLINGLHTKWDKVKSIFRYFWPSASCCVKCCVNWISQITTTMLNIFPHSRCPRVCAVVGLRALIKFHPKFAATYFWRRKFDFAEILWGRRWWWG